MIGLSSDHAGFEYKEKIKALLSEMNLPCRDYGPASSEPTDYPDWAYLLCSAIARGECEKGILVCGTGVGMSIAANKHKGIRAAACESATAARLARQHNDANVLAIGQRLIGWEVAADIVRAFLTSSFEGGRHQRRVEKIHAREHDR